LYADERRLLFGLNSYWNCYSSMVTSLEGEMMGHRFMVSMLVLGFATLPVGAVDYCKADGVPKGCVARPEAAGATAGGPYRDRRHEAVSPSPQKIEESGRLAPTITRRQGQANKCWTTDTAKCPNTTNSSGDQRPD
jgi:hypothetical protein